MDLLLGGDLKKKIKETRHLKIEEIKRIFYELLLGI